MRDLRDTIRLLGRSPGFVAIVVLTVGAAIAANTAVFSVLNGLVLRPLSAPQPDRLVRLYPLDAEHVRQNLAPYDDYRTYRDAGAALADVAAYVPEQVTVATRESAAAPHIAYFVSTSYFGLLGAHPALGRLFDTHETGERGAVPVAVVSERFWRTSLDAVPDALGRRVIVNGASVTIVGVLPAGFVGTEPLSADLWIPLSTRGALGFGLARSDASSSVLMLARLRPGVTLARAADALSATAAIIGGRTKRPGRPHAVQVVPATFFPLDRDPMQAAGAVLAALALVLAVASANVANLVLTRILQRQRELAIRVSLGATRRRILVQLLAEALCLGALSAGVGLLLCEWSLSLVAPVALALVPSDWGAMAFDLSPDLRVFGYVAGATTISLVIAGLAPALAGTRLDLSAALHGETVVGSQRIAPALLRRVLLFAQVAGTTVLLVTGGLLARAARQAEVVDLGFDPASVFIARPDVLRSGSSVAEAARVARAMLERAARVAGSSDAALVSHVPLTGGARFADVTSLASGSGNPGRVSCRVVTTTPNYFAILRVAFVSGRTFGPSETSAAVVGEVLARKLWPDGRWLGRPVRVGDTGHEYQVVGVVRDTRASALWRDKEAAVYLAPSSEADVASLALVVRSSSSDDRGVPAAMAAIVRDLAPRTPTRVERLSDLVALWTLPSRLAAGSSLAIGIAALALALVGAYAATSVGVKRRAREIGIRIALGATPRDVARVVMGEGLAVSAVGVTLGLAVAAAVGQAIRAFLFGVPPLDAPALGGSALLVLAAMTVACYVPARRAARTPALLSLRSE